MPVRNTNKSNIVDEIKKKIKMLNFTVLFIVFVIVLIISRFMHEFLSYIPLNSVITMLVLMATLAIASIFLSQSISIRAINAIDEYDGKMSSMLKTTKEIKDIGYSDLLLERILNSAIEITKADGGSLLLMDGDMLEFKIVVGNKETDLKGVKIPKSKGIVGWVVENGTTLRVEDVSKNSKFFPEVDKITSYETVSVLCVPLKSGETVIGALELVNKMDGPFTIEDEELINYFAGQATYAFERTRFLEDEKNFEIHLTNLLINAIDSLSGKQDHSKKVAKYSLIIASALNLGDDVKRRIYRAALLHDIGFIKIHFDDENITMEKFRSHVKEGFELLKPINFYSDIASLVLNHHERWDGTGYPNGLRGAGIPLESRIIAVSEAFDAMVSRKSYKQVDMISGKGKQQGAVGFQNAVQELKLNSGTQFDPIVVDAFLANISEEDTQ